MKTIGSEVSKNSINWLEKDMIETKEWRHKLSKGGMKERAPDFTDIKTIRGYYEQFCAHKFDNYVKFKNY